MRPNRSVIIAIGALIALASPPCVLGQALSGVASDGSPAVDWATVAKIREEGLQHSRLAETLSFMTDVLGARLTLSEGMTRAQAWAVAEMEGTGLTSVGLEPFMDYGVSWDNEYVSLHLLAPDYQPMVGYPLAHTPGTDGRKVLDVVIADVQTYQDLERYRGRLAGKAVLSTPRLR
jgi:carboxypeptidase Q